VCPLYSVCPSRLRWLVVAFLALPRPCCLIFCRTFLLSFALHTLTITLWTLSLYFVLPTSLAFFARPDSPYPRVSPSARLGCWSVVALFIAYQRALSRVCDCDDVCDPRRCVVESDSGVRVSLDDRPAPSRNEGALEASVPYAPTPSETTPSPEYLPASS
jgi:hypothetical protein